MNYILEKKKNALPAIGRMKGKSPKRMGTDEFVDQWRNLSDRRL